MDPNETARMLANNLAIAGKSGARTAWDRVSEYAGYLVDWKRKGGFDPSEDNIARVYAAYDKAISKRACPQRVDRVLATLFALWRKA